MIHPRKAHEEPTLDCAPDSPPTGVGRGWGKDHDRGEANQKIDGAIDWFAPSGTAHRMSSQRSGHANREVVQGVEAAT